MSKNEINMSEINKYKEEAKEKWGNTSAFTQSEKKTKKYGKAEWEKITSEMDELLKSFSLHVGEKPEEEVLSLVKKWQKHITDNYYTCTDEILKGLGKMYVLDSRFTESMDKYKEGTAKLISEAIEIYCK